MGKDNASLSFQNSKLELSLVVFNSYIVKLQFKLGAKNKDVFFIRRSTVSKKPIGNEYINGHDSQRY